MVVAILIAQILNPAPNDSVANVYANLQYIGEYFSNVTVIATLIEVLVSRRLPLDRLFYLTSGTLALGDKPIGLTRPGVTLRAFRHAQECHVGFSPQLEEQMCSFVPGVTTKSPDRMDALVWAVTELLIDQEEWTDTRGSSDRVVISRF